MRNLGVFSWHLLMMCCVSWLSINLVASHASTQCLNDQISLLLQMKNTLTFNTSRSIKLVKWDESRDCCSWAGVTCNEAGRVTGLDLFNESISGGFNNSNSLFHLGYLQTLNLAYNDFNNTKIPPGFEKLMSLTHLNLSSSNFSGQVPIGISSLTSLVTLDLSDHDYNDGLKLENPNLAVLVQNLTELRRLYLDRVNMSAEENNDWCQALSSSLPNLQVLSLRGCGLSGPIHSSLVKLRSLSVINLYYNNFSAAPFPNFFTNFPNLTHLSLRSCELYGTFPEKILQLQTLEYLDISYNFLLHVSLPTFPPNSSLHTLLLSWTNVSGKLQLDTFANLKKLSTLILSGCNFSGSIPNSFAKLPWVDLNLYNNSLSGSIPYSLFGSPFLQTLELSYNQFSGQLPEFSNPSSYVFQYLYLSRNNLEGPVPPSLFEIQSLSDLDLSYNKFNGTIEANTIRKNSNLIYLSLSYNNISVNISTDDFTFPPSIEILRLASCNLRAFPNLRNHSWMRELDLSNNRIDGKIPNWIWNIWDERIGITLNLSCNSLENVERPYPNPLIWFYILDLHSNMLQGNLQSLLPTDMEAYFIDLSRNKLFGNIPESICNFQGNYIDLSRNKLFGNIPESICNSNYLEFIDFSHNALNGPIPSCLVDKTNSYLKSLNLHNNSLSGPFLVNFSSGCVLETLNLSDNKIKGPLPRALSNCKNLQVLNLGNNLINENFPCWLTSLSSLQVLVLQSNRFRGQLKCVEPNITWPKLQIFDLASNNFDGNLPTEFFSNFKAMMLTKDGAQPKHNYLDHKIFGIYYQDTVTVTTKGLELELVKILTLFTSIDLSNNLFQGEIPEVVGQLTQLLVLNISQNALTGQIPSSIGNLKQLESLDLSLNHLSGAIPMQLSNLNFIEFLNLSYNQLEGVIPTSTQLQSFPEASFQGNKRLCGAPLNIKCKAIGSLPPLSEDKHLDVETDEIKWEIISVEIGYFFGLAAVVGLCIFSKRWRRWYSKLVNQIVIIILCTKDRRGNRTRRAR